MANITNVSISITPDSFLAGGPVEVEVTYNVHFTPMERLLAAYGLSFFERVVLHEVDNPPNLDDFIDVMVSSDIIPSADIAIAPGNNLVRVKTRIYDRPDLRGPDDDEHRYWERIRACVSIWPRPANPSRISSDRLCSAGFARVHTQGPTVTNG